METKLPFNPFPRPKLAIPFNPFPRPKLADKLEISDAKKWSSEKFKIGTGYGSADEYEVLDKISQGSYGMVYRAREKKTGRVVAMKEEFHGFSKSTLREIDILQSLVGLPWFVEFKQVVVDEYDCVYVVMEYIETDLQRLMDVIKRALTVREVKYMMKQLLAGIAFLHENRIMHRDLKPSNILFTKDGKLKICDYGLSKRFERRIDQHSHHVGTSWYKAPELLIGAKTYSCAIDMWSVGCIMAQLLLNQRLFEEGTKNNQLQKIAKTLRLGLNKKFSMLSEKGLDLLSKLLTYNPDDRITANKALDHDWLREI